MWEEQTPNYPNTIVIARDGLNGKDKAKLKSIEAGAEVNKINHLYIDGKIAKVDPDTKTVLTDLASTDKVNKDVNTLVTAIESEEASRIAADREIVDATNKEIERLDKRVDDLEKGSSEALDNEIVRAKNAEAVIAADLVTEVKRATNKEAVLKAAIETESSRAEAAEADLTTGLAGEVSRATGKEAELVTAIETEKSRAVAKEAELNTAIATETARATAAEEALDAKFVVTVDDWAKFVWNYPTILDNTSLGETATLGTTVLG